MHTTQRYQYCVFPEGVRPLPSYTFGTKVMAQGSSARRRLEQEPVGHYVQYNSEWCWMNLASTCGGIQVGIPVIISENKERFVEVPRG
jgi:hypothetical protein